MGGLLINSEESLINSAVPNINRGNTRTGPTGVLAENFNPLVADASITYTLDSFPLYKGAFPIKGFGEYLDNVAIESNNKAWLAGLTFGKAAKKGTWELTYQYRNLEGNSWYEEFPDDDFGAFYHAVPANSAASAKSFGPGTNVRGHYVKAVYALYDSLTFGLTYYRGEAIAEVPKGSGSTASHLLVEDFGTTKYVYLQPGPNDGLADAFSTADFAGRLYHSPIEDEPWAPNSMTFADQGELVLNSDNGEDVYQEDVVMWYAGHLSHAVADGPNQWHYVGPTLWCL